jgi:hypothetical protein
MSEGRSVEFMGRVHVVMAERGSRVANQGHMVTKLHGEPPGRLDAGVSEQAHGDDVGDAVLLELEVEVRVGETTQMPLGNSGSGRDRSVLKALAYLGAYLGNGNHGESDAAPAGHP